MLLPYLLLSLPGLIAAVLVRLWALHRKWDRSTRAWLVALTIGLFCSPGVSVAGYGIAVIVPSFLALIMPGGQKPKFWGIFVVSSAFTTLITYGLYELVSKSNDRTDDQGGAEQLGSQSDK